MTSRRGYAGATPVAQTLVTDRRATSRVHTPDLDTALREFLIPTGGVIPYAVAAAPIGWLLCNGAAVSRVDFKRLFDVIGVTFGAGDASTTFNVPNLKGRIPVGLDTAQVEFDVLGEAGGAKTHTLAGTETPTHTHNGPSHTHTLNKLTRTNVEAGGHGTKSPGDGFSDRLVVLDSAGTNLATLSGGTEATANPNGGSGAAHNNLQPYMVLPYIIKT